MDAPARLTLVLAMLCLATAGTAWADRQETAAGPGLDGTLRATRQVCVHVASRGRHHLSSDLPVKAEVARIWRLNGVDIVYPPVRDQHACRNPETRWILLALVEGPETLEAISHGTAR